MAPRTARNCSKLTLSECTRLSRSSELATETRRSDTPAPVTPPGNNAKPEIILFGYIRKRVREIPEWAIV
jgi:hypothetical protein